MTRVTAMESGRAHGRVFSGSNDVLSFLSLQLSLDDLHLRCLRAILRQRRQKEMSPLLWTFQPVVFIQGVLQRLDW